VTRRAWTETGPTMTTITDLGDFKALDDAAAARQEPTG
jgi:hypothetical protein